MHNLFLVYFVNLYRFRAYLGPSSGGKSYAHQLVLISLFRRLFVVLVGLDSNLYLTMMGLDMPETCRGWRNILRISCAYRKTNLLHNLFLVYFVNLYRFRTCLGPSSGGTTLCIQQLALISLFRWLFVVLVGLNSNLYPLMMGLDMPETYRGWRNILRICCASRWFFFARLYRDAR